MRRVALYVRVSTAEQKNHGLSVDSQIEALTEYAKEHGYSVAGIYNDAGYSARKKYTQRPALLQMVSDCKAGKVDMILFTKLDRFFRSVKDYYSVMEQIGDIPWRSIWEDYETETSSGVFKVNIMLSVAQSEADRTSERIKSIMEYKRAKGDYIGQAPIGYKRENQRLVKDPETQEGVAAFFRAYLDYKPIKECVAIAALHGVAIRRNTAYDMLDSMTYAGDAYGTPCEPYITLQEHEDIGNRKRNYVRTPALCRTYIFQGVAYCGYCGQKLACSARRRESKKRGQYLQMVYQCRNTIGDYQDHPPCTGCGINEEILESMMLESIEDAVQKYNMEIACTDLAQVAKSTKAQIIKLESKLHRIGERYEDGDIDREEYVAKRDNIKAEIVQLRATSEPVRPVELPKDWRGMYDSLCPEDRRIFWQRSVKKIKLYKGRQIEIVF